MASLLSKVDFGKIAEYIYRKTGIFLEADKHFEKLAKYIDNRAKAIGIDSFRKYFYTLRFEDKDGAEKYFYEEVTPKLTQIVENKVIELGLNN